MNDTKKKPGSPETTELGTHQNQGITSDTAPEKSSEISPEDAENHKLGTGRLIDVLGIGDSDILHKVLDKFKADIRERHNREHDGYKVFWRNCGKIGCATNFEAVRQAELLVYGEVQND